MKRLAIIFALLLSSSYLYAFEIRDIPHQITPVYTYSLEKEKDFLELFPIIYLEENIHQLSDTSLDMLISLVREKNLGICFYVEDGELKEFCKFYVSLMILGIDSEDMLSFEDGILGQMGRIALSISSLKSGKTEEARKIFSEVKSREVITIFSDMKYFFDAESKDALKDWRRLSKPFLREAIAYKILSRDVNQLDEQIRAYLDDGLVSYLLARGHFRSGEYRKAADLFIKSAKNKDISEQALVYAAYSYLLDRRFSEAERIHHYLKKEEREKIHFILDLTYNRRGNINFIKYQDDENFVYTLKNLLRYFIDKGVKINLPAAISVQAISDSELAFLICATKIMENPKGQTATACYNNSWKNKDEELFFRDLFDGNLERKESIRIIENLKLFNYYPFSRYYADFLLKTNNHDRAGKLYEKIIREEKHLGNEDLYVLYLNFSKTFRFKKSYFTAKKILEEAMHKVKGKDDQLRLEYLSILLEQGECEEILWRAEAYLPDTADDYIKKELQKIIEICYEKLGKIMKQEKE